MQEQKNVPASALRFAIGTMELGDNGEGSKTAPFRMVARSGEPIQHWYWGKTIHDFAGMRVKPRIPIDYVHDEKEIVGYANHITADGGNLEVSGALTPFKDSDRATEIVHKARMGVPYEASINFSSDDLTIEKLSEGQVETINGREITGPATVFRDWPLRGVAVCPYGYDQQTQTTLSSNDQTVTIFTKDQEMSEDTTTEVEATVAVEAVSVTDEAIMAVDEDRSVLADGLRFVDAFGDQGAKWFLEGKTFEQCQGLMNQQLLGRSEELAEENERLKQQLSAARLSGEEEPIERSANDAEQTKRKHSGFSHLVKLQGKIYEE